MPFNMENETLEGQHFCDLKKMLDSLRDQFIAGAKAEAKQIWLSEKQKRYNLQLSALHNHCMMALMMQMKESTKTEHMNEPIARLQKGKKLCMDVAAKNAAEFLTLMPEVINDEKLETFEIQKVLAGQLRQLASELEESVVL
jgi:hypothetical protein